MQSCKCQNATVVQYINQVVMDTNHKLIELDQFDITDACVPKLNQCLKKHGFNGAVTTYGNKFVYLGGN